MCRIFGFKSILQSTVHNSLIQADNAMATQSRNHPDGWGVSYYTMGTPHVIKSSKTALSDTLFNKVSGVVSSHCVLAHIRKATQGKISSINTHPFQFGKWTFAHNGNIENFKDLQADIFQQIKPEYSKFILGETDSEHIFFFLLSELSNEFDLSSNDLESESFLKATQDALIKIQKIIGPNSLEEKSFDKTFLTFILTNGESMVGFQGGQPLYFCTYKKKCSERETCPKFESFCESPSIDGRVNHLIISSEPTEGENIWVSLTPGQLIGINNKMTYTILNTSVSFF